jgi:hypothetical protein
MYVWKLAGQDRIWSTLHSNFGPVKSFVNFEHEFLLNTKGGRVESE